MVLLNTIVIIHDIPLINNPVITEPCQIIFFSPHRFKDSRSISWQENHIEGGGGKKIKRRKEVILPYHSPTPRGRLGSLTPDNRMA